MKRISPLEFRDAFATVICSKIATVHKTWRNTKEYTAFVRTEVLAPIAQLLLLQPWTKGDYNRLDAVFYDKADSEHFGKATYASALNVIVEHENARGPTTYTEINKLQHYNSPLKVLICYASDAAERSKLLAEYEKIIRNADIFGDIATLRRQLVIFGILPREGTLWTFHAYESSGFIDLPALEIAPGRPAE
jgi:hypothetical protein